MESSSMDSRNWISYGIAANAYTKAGLQDKALAALRKAEELSLGDNSENEAYEYLITQYGTVGMKGDVLRIWELYKKNKKIRNSGYLCIITSLFNLNDTENAEKVFEDWESNNKTYDLRIPNFLIGAFSRKGFMGKAEAIKERIVLKGKKPNEATWVNLSAGYIQVKENGKAVEALKEAIVVCSPGWKPGKAILSACLQYLQEKGDFNETIGFINSLKDKDIIPEDIHEKMVNSMKNKSASPVLGLPKAMPCSDTQM